jgi:hypothetical protein
MKKLVLISILFFVFVMNGFSQFDCKVLVDNLQGQYNGDCKKGLANGEGSAKGIDTYIGNFRKGFPNGFGVYTYENGSNYIGKFRKGLKDGYGLKNTITEAGDLVQYYGLWMADSLIVPDDSRALFKVNLSKGIKIVDPKLTRDISKKNEVWINFQVDGVIDKSVIFENAEISNGKQIDTKERSLNTLVAFEDIKEFPVTINLKYQIRKTEQLFMVDCETEIILFTKGLWEININH